MVTLVCATEDATTEATMASIEGLIKHTRTPGVVRASALRAWAFMASLYTAREMAAPADRMIAPISAHLQHANVHVRSAAGTCLALIAETRGSAPDEDDAEDGDGKAAEDEGDDYAFGDESDSGGESEEDYDEDEVEDRKKEWNWRTALGDDWLEDADEGPARRTYLLEKLAADTAERLNALRTEGAKHRNRKEKRALRSAFRDVYATVVEDVVPVSVIRIREAVANLYGWGRRIQLNTFRDLLGPGLQQHLEVRVWPCVCVALGGVLTPWVVAHSLASCCTQYWMCPAGLHVGTKTVLPRPSAYAFAVCVCGVVCWAPHLRCHPCPHNSAHSSADPLKLIASARKTGKQAATTRLQPMPDSRHRVARSSPGAAYSIARGVTCVMTQQSTAQHCGHVDVVGRAVLCNSVKSLQR